MRTKCFLSKYSYHRDLCTFFSAPDTKTASASYMLLCRDSLMCFRLNNLLGRKASEADVSFLCIYVISILFCLDHDVFSEPILLENQSSITIAFKQTHILSPKRWESGLGWGRATWRSPDSGLAPPGDYFNHWEMEKTYTGSVSPAQSAAGDHWDFLRQTQFDLNIYSINHSPWSHYSHFNKRLWPDLSSLLCFQRDIMKHPNL